MKPRIESEDWPACCSRVKDAMRDWVMRFVTPISVSPEYGQGMSWGTGTYLEMSGKVLLLTNNHVVADVPDGSRLAHLPGPTDDYVAVDGRWSQAPYPVDAACTGIRSSGSGGMKPGVAYVLVEPRFAAEEGELLFWVGFPGFTAGRHESPTEARQRMTRFSGPLEMVALPMLSQVVREWDGDDKSRFDSCFHVAVHYPMEAQRSANGPLLPLPNPKGMSGSLLWDTKFLSSRARSRPWSPADARVCGLVWAALDSPEVVIATKIEHVRQALRWP